MSDLNIVTNNTMWSSEKILHIKNMRQILLYKLSALRYTFPKFEGPFKKFIFLIFTLLILTM